MKNPYPIRKAEQPTFYFIGVSTGGSSMNQIFPHWMEALGHQQVVLKGVDHPLHDHTEAYRRTVAQIKHDPLSIGGLVTTHKIDLYNAAAGLFDELDIYAKICGEVACISKRGGAMIGGAVDPLTAGLSLDAILGSTYFERSSGEVLCFGAGGAGTAIALNLLARPTPGDRPNRFTAVDLSQDRLERLHRMVEGQETEISFEYVHNSDPRLNDSLLEEMPPGSLVINATGMGKDTPGSPLTGGAVFTQRAVAWELNYRGALDFYHQALAQQASRELKVEDGWLYFLHGWTTIIGQVLGVEITPAIFERLAQIASSFRPAS
jgi:shikimate dehydrogenase